jgi:hypothetical protein
MASIDEQPRKRARTDDDLSADAPPSSQEKPIIRGSPWLYDGNIILQAEDTQFRVLESILTMNSAVFRDMLSMPQLEGQEKVEGCPVVVMHDTALDLGRLLEAMFLHECVMKSIVIAT